jgi:hypothetical protein
MLKVFRRDRGWYKSSILGTKILFLTQNTLTSSKKEFHHSSLIACKPCFESLTNFNLLYSLYLDIFIIMFEITHM